MFDRNPSATSGGIHNAAKPNQTAYDFSLQELSFSRLPASIAQNPTMWTEIVFADDMRSSYVVDGPNIIPPVAGNEYSIEFNGEFIDYLTLNKFVTYLKRQSSVRVFRRPFETRCFISTPASRAVIKETFEHALSDVEKVFDNMKPDLMYSANGRR